MIGIKNYVLVIFFLFYLISLNLSILPQPAPRLPTSPTFDGPEKNYLYKFQLSTVSLKESPEITEAVLKLKEVIDKKDWDKVIPRFVWLYDNAKNDHVYKTDDHVYIGVKEALLQFLKALPAPVVKRIVSELVASQKIFLELKRREITKGTVKKLKNILDKIPFLFVSEEYLPAFIRLVKLLFEQGNCYEVVHLFTPIFHFASKNKKIYEDIASVLPYCLYCLKRIGDTSSITQFPQAVKSNDGASLFQSLIKIIKDNQKIYKKLNKFVDLISNKDIKLSLANKKKQPHKLENFKLLSELSINYDMAEIPKNVVVINMDEYTCDSTDGCSKISLLSDKVRPHLIKVIGIGEPQIVERRIYRETDMFIGSNIAPLFDTKEDIIYINNQNAILAFKLLRAKSCGNDAKSNCLELLWKSRISETLFEINAPERRYTLSTNGKYIFGSLINNVKLPELKLGFLPVKYEVNYNSLLSVDRKTGKLNWKLGGVTDVEEKKESSLSDNTLEQLSKQEPIEQKFKDVISFQQAPIIWDNKIYASCIYQPAQTDPFYHYIVSIDAKTGKILWKTFIASGFLELNFFNNPANTPFGSFLKHDKDNIYYLTNMGAIACVSKDDGRVKWIRKYEQYELEPPFNPYVVNFMPTSMLDSQILLTPGDEKSELQQNSLVFAPVDSPFIYSIDSATAQLNNFKSLYIRPKDIQFLLNAFNGKVILQSKNHLFAFDIKTGELLWKTLNLNILGRAALSKNYAYLPTAEGIVKVNLKNGKVEATLEWSENTPGDIFIPKSNILIYSTNKFVKVFYEFPNP